MDKGGIVQKLKDMIKAAIDESNSADGLEFIYYLVMDANISREAAGA